MNFRCPADPSFLYLHVSVATVLQGQDKIDTLCIPIRGVLSSVENLLYFEESVFLSYQINLKFLLFILAQQRVVRCFCARVGNLETLLGPETCCMA
jgi:hypothetical protein